MRYMRHAIHHDLKRYRDLLLHLFGGDSRPLRNDFHVVVRHVGIGFDGQLMEGNPAPDEQQERSHHHEKAVIQSKIDNLCDHCSTVFWNTSAFCTNRSPGLIPLTTSWRLPGSMFPAVTSRRLKRPFPSGE